MRAIGAGVECVGAVVLLAASRALDGEVRVGQLAVGFAAGYLYRHSRAAAGCRRLRGARDGVGVALWWTALGVAVDRSVDDPAASRAFAAGIGLGSAGYWLARRGG